MNRHSRNRAWWRSTGGWKLPGWPTPANEAEWKRVDGDVRMELAARILEQQDQEPWKRKFDAYSHDVNARRAKREADSAWVEQHPWQAFVYLSVRRMFRWR